MLEIRIIDRNKTTTLTAESGARLSDILTDGGFFVDMPCGANGKCGKCALTVNGKDVNTVAAIRSASKILVIFFIFYPPQKDFM